MFAVVKDAQGNDTYVKVNEIAEQNDAGTANTTATYVALAVDKNGNILATQPNETVQVNIGEPADNDGKADNTNVGTQTVALGTTFTSSSVDDIYADNNETFTVSVVNNSLTNASKYEEVKYSTNDVTTTIKDNDRLSLNIDTVMVDEDALLGTTDADNYDPDIKEFTGSLGLNVVDTSTVDLKFEGGQSTNITSQSQKIFLHLSSQDEILKGISADGREIFEITLNESNGTYTFKLKDVVDHPDINSEDLISSLGINVIAMRGSDITSAEIKISIADDIPTAESVVITAESKFSTTSTNLVLAIDNSGSMGSGSTSKMELAKQAAIKLIEKYDQYGDVNIKVISFNGTATSTIWFTNVQDAKNAITALYAGGNTDYEDLLNKTINNFNTVNDPKPTADQDIFYMLSDGNPTEGDANGPDNVSGILPSWKNFAESNFDDVYTIGIGTNVDLDGNNRGSLEEIGDISVGHDPFIVKNVADLTDELLATIVNINAELVLNTGDNKLNFSFGADGPADGTGPKLDGNKIAFSWGDADLTNGVGAIINDNDGTGPQLTWLVYNNGKVILAKDVNTGEILIKLEARDILSNNPTYEVTQFKANTGINKLEIPYTVVDGDGDGSTATLTINIDYSKQNTPPEAEDRHFELDCQKDDVYTIGLKSEYYGVNTQISNLTQFKSIVSSNNPDATFTATKIDYGYGIGDVSKGTNLQAFLKNDASSLSNDPADTTDGGIHMYGKVFLTAGTYNFKVYADDGYDILIDGTSVASFENNQSPATKIHNQFIIAQDGYYDIEMFWWDQGGAYVFKPEISSDGGLTYKTLDSTMLFTQIDDSTNNTNKIEFTLEDFVSDIEDDSTSTIVKIKIVSLPEDGILTVNGNPVQIGDIFDEKTNIVYTPNANQEDTLYGTMSDVGTLSEWGTVNNGVLTTDDGKAIIKAYTNGTLGEVGFASENNNHSHDGLGLGVVGSTDNDQIESTANEKIVIEFKEIVTKAEFGLASLGGNFTPGNSADANAHWVAYKDGVKVAEGDVKQSIDDSNPTTNTFKINVEFDKIEFTTTANVNSNYSIQYMNVDYKIDDSFNYISIDSNGAESELATVTFDLATMCLVKNSPPVADPVRTTSNLDSDDALLSTFALNSNTPNKNDIAFFKVLSIGGGLDGDTSVKENDASDPADLGGQDLETTESKLVFDITLLPSYGTVYIGVGNTITALDVSNLNSANTLLSTADTVYWAATHQQVPSGTQKSIGGVYDSGIEASWTNQTDVTVIARDGNNRESSISYSQTNGIGVVAPTGGPSEQLGYDVSANKSESIIFDFTKPVTDASVAITHLIKDEGNGEIGKFEAFLDGKSLGVFTFTNNENISGIDYYLVAEAHGTGNPADTNSGTLNINNLVFDQLVFSAREYANQSGQTVDSSDYFIGGIVYHEVPSAEFKYKVIDEGGLSSTEVPVIIDVCTNTPITPANTNSIVAVDDVITENCLYITTPNKHDISHVDLYIRESSGNIIKIKIDNFPDGHKAIDVSAFMKEHYPNADLISAYFVKAGNNSAGSDLVILEDNITASNLPLSSKFDKVYEYSNVSTLIKDVDMSTINTNTVTISVSTILGNDYDPQSDSFTISKVLNSQNGTAVLNNDGTITFTKGVNYNTSGGSFEYTIVDSKGAVDTAKVTLEGPNCNIISKDFPTAYNETNTLNVAPIKTNLVITFDVSGSMSNKLALAKEATINMINKYSAQGEVKVLLTKFSDYGTTLSDNGSVWLSASKAISLINGFTANGGTNYDDALLDVISSMKSKPAPLSGQTISYFISDGEPTYGMIDKDNNGTYETRTGNGSSNQNPLPGVNDKIATDFKALGFNETYSVGIGTNISNTYLQEIAVDGVSDVIIVSNANDLNTTLQSMVVSSVSGNVLENIDFSTTTGKIVSITVDGVEYTTTNYPNTGINTVQGAKLVFNFVTGDYTYSKSTNNTSIDSVETFKIKAENSNLDEVTFDLKIKTDVQPLQSVDKLNIDQQDTIDLTSAITNANKGITDVVDMTNSKLNVLNVDIQDVIDLVDSDKELIIRGDLHDKVQLDQNDWASGGKEELNGVNYNVYKGTGTNSTVKLLIEDDIDITPDI